MNDDRDDELTALLATHRPDPAAFARGVAARLRERETRMAAPAPRRAAGVTPLDLGAVASSNGVLLSAPLLVVSMVAAAFAACFRGLRHTIARSSARTTTAAERRAVGARIFGIGWTMAMFVVMSYFWFAPQWFQGTGLAVVALLAAIGLVFAVGRHARSGIDRALVATLGIGILEVILAIGVSWFVAEPSSSPAQWRTPALCVLATGALAVAALGRRTTPGVVLLFGAVLLVPPLVPRSANPTTADLASAAVAAPNIDDPFVLSHHANLVLTARAEGLTIQSPTSIATSLRERVATGSAALPLLPLITAAQRLGMVDVASWRTLAEQPQLRHAMERLLDDDRPLRMEWWDEGLVAMALATRTVDDPTRDRIAQRLFAALETSPRPLHEWASALRVLTTLDRGQLAEPWRATVHDLLVRHQYRGQWSPGGFVMTTTIPGSDLDATHAAIELMEHFGVPEGVDAIALDRHLRNGSRLHPTNDDRVRVWQLTAFADRLRLERITGPLHRPFSRLLVEEHTFFAITALVLLCLYAVWVSPRGIPAAAGAMP